MLERGIDTIDLFTVLRDGFVDDAPIVEANGDWRCKVTRKLTTGGRTAGAVTVISSGKKLFVVTVEWEDGK